MKRLMKEPIKPGTTFDSLSLASPPRVPDLNSKVPMTY